MVGMELEQLWMVALNEIELQISRANFYTWLKNSRLVDKKEGVFYVALPNNFAREWVEAKYQKTLLGILRNHDYSVKKLEFVVGGGSAETLAPQKVTVADLNRAENRIELDFKVDPESNLNPRYTAKNFIVGASNELAYSAATAIIQEVGTKYNPFFVYGGVGLGKTHLVQMIGNEIKALYGGKIRPRYVSSEKFTSDIVWAIRNKRMEDIKKKYRDVDVLIIDDIQFIGGKEKTEEEFFHTFNALYENNKQIIISSDRPPQSIPTLEERLRSRFEGGLITDIGYPEYEMRMAIIKNKLQESNRELRDEIVDLVARKVKKNIRELVGVVNKIIFYQDVKKTEITEKIAEEIIEKSIRNFARKVSDDHILKSVAEFFNISISDLIEKGRRKEVVEPRQVAMFLMREILDVSYPYIGEKLGRDHTTAIHAVEKINQEIAKNSALNQKINLIKEVIFKT
ncbi:MAG: Chromosomal replication initiator protein DnaA [Parcubacteria group bacterium GW2011_GWA1_59_11]|nr:MAG: Chromosomal replication initiator protein DnaA [Parcubacteria group bacterium GW2011_GWA1_59_11]